MEIALAALSIVVGLALFYTGLRRIELSNVAKSIVWFLDLAVLIAGIVLLGPLGAVVFAVGTVIAVLGWSIYLAAQKQTHLIYASTQAEAKKEEMYALHRRLWESHEAFHVLGPIETARLISLLAQRHRSPAEIEEMAAPITMLWVIHRPDLDWLVGRFDSLLRLYGEPASASMRFADTLTAATKESAATFNEMVEAMRAAVTSDAGESAA